jgi:predicted RNA-binding protein associated with RNAse of E/G family
VGTYDHQLIVDEPELKIMLMEDYDGEPIRINDETVVEPGASLLWYVLPGAWHDIGRFHLADDTLTGWYTNLCTPIEMEGETWSSTDLFLDHWMTPEGKHSWLDEDELTGAIDAGLVSAEWQRSIEKERATIQSNLDVGAWPPPIALEFGLEEARACLQ